MEKCQRYRSRWRPAFRRTALPAVALIFTLAGQPSFAQASKTASASKPQSASKNWSQPKTPWGDPDIQGTWTSDDCIGAPMNRPANFGDRLNFTEQELAQR